MQIFLNRNCYVIDTTVCTTELVGIKLDLVVKKIWYEHFEADLITYYNYTSLSSINRYWLNHFKMSYTIIRLK